MRALTLLVVLFSTAALAQSNTGKCRLGPDGSLVCPEEKGKRAKKGERAKKATAKPQPKGQAAREMPEVDLLAPLGPAPVPKATPTPEPTEQPAVAQREEPAPPPPETVSSPPAVAGEQTAGRAAPMATVSLKAGAAFPQLLNRLGTSMAGAVELGYLTPLLDHRLAVALELAFSEPVHQRSLEDPRVTGGAVSYTVRERTLGVFLGPKYYFLPLAEPIAAFAAAGVRAQLLSSQLDADAGGSAFGRYLESGNHAAFAGQAGVGYQLGPGHAALELQMISSPIEHLVTGKVDVGDLTLRAGYLLHF